MRAPARVEKGFHACSFVCLCSRSCCLRTDAREMVRSACSGGGGWNKRHWEYSSQGSAGGYFRSNAYSEYSTAVLAGAHCERVLGSVLVDGGADDCVRAARTHAHTGGMRWLGPQGGEARACARVAWMGVRGTVVRRWRTRPACTRHGQPTGAGYRGYSDPVPILSTPYSDYQYSYSDISSRVRSSIILRAARPCGVPCTARRSGIGRCRRRQPGTSWSRLACCRT